MKHSRILVTIILGLGFALALMWMLCGASSPAMARNGLVLVPSSLTRQHAPVVISGSLLLDLTGKPLEEIFVYAYEGTILTLTQQGFANEQAKEHAESSWEMVLNNMKELIEKE